MTAANPCHDPNSLASPSSADDAQSSQCRPEVHTARVVETFRESALVSFSSGQVVTARLALGPAYRLRRGDDVLLLGQADDHYVIGVVKGRGRLLFDAPFLKIRSVRGKLTLSAGEAIEMRARNVEWLATRKLTIDADAWLVRANNLAQYVSETLAVLTRNYDQVVDKQWSAQARRACLKVKSIFNINGEIVRIG